MGEVVAESVPVAMMRELDHLADWHSSPPGPDRTRATVQSFARMRQAALDAMTAAQPLAEDDARTVWQVVLIMVDCLTTIATVGARLDARV
jgi:hypothetical protein